MRLEAAHEAERSPGLLLWRLTMGWQARQRAALRPHGLTHVQFVLLAVLVHAGDAPLAQATLADRAGLDPMMTSQVVRALEAKALVTRAIADGDARVRLVSATAEGAELVNKAVVDVEQVDAQVFAPLGEGVSAFARDLARLLEHAEANSPNAAGTTSWTQERPGEAPAR